MTQDAAIKFVESIGVTLGLERVNARFNTNK